MPHRFRSLFRPRQERSRPAPGPPPKIGARVIWREVSMIVPVDLDDDLWNWLLAHGWRESTYQPERRRYREAPRSSIEDLLVVPDEMRAVVLRDALARATFAPASRP
jgi:hypothetical protein